MIRINLLPFRAARKRENIKRQITFYVLCVIMLLCGMAYFYVNLKSRVSDLNEKKSRIQAELTVLQATIKKIDKLEKMTEELKTKLNVIRDLEKAKTGPLMLLDEISSAVPSGKLYLTSLKESNGILTLTGTAMDNETVALFMTNLEASEHIKEVDLNTTKMRSLPNNRLRVSDFQLQCKTYAFKEKTPVTPDKTNKGKKTK